MPFLGYDRLPIAVSPLMLSPERLVMRPSCTRMTWRQRSAMALSWGAMTRVVPCSVLRASSNLAFLGLPIPAGFAKGADRFRGPGRVRMTTPAQA